LLIIATITENQYFLEQDLLIVSADRSRKLNRRAIEDITEDTGSGGFESMFLNAWYNPHLLLKFCKFSYRSVFMNQQSLNLQ